MNRLFASLLFSSAFLGLYSGSAAAEDPLEEQSTTLNRFAGDVRNYCKYNDFKASIDIESFAKPAKADPSRVSDLRAHCQSPLRAIREWCALGFGETIGKEITSYVCKYDAGEPKTIVENGVLTMTTPWDADGDWAKYVKRSTGKILRHGEFGAAQAELIRNDQGRIKDLTLDMKRHCEGAKPDFSVDWRSFEKEIDKRTVKNDLRAIWQECYEPLRVLELRCNNAQSKLMNDQVKSFKCLHNDDKEPHITLEDKVLTLHANMKTEQPGIWVEEAIGDLLQDGDFTVRQTDFIKDEDASFKRVFGDELVYKCNATIDWKIDWKSFKKEIDKRTSKEDKTSIYDACGVPLNRLMDVCGSPKVAKKIQKKIKSFTCTFGGKRKRKLTLKRGKLKYVVDFGVKDAYPYVDKFLVKKRIIKKRPPPKKLTAKELNNIRRILGEGVSPKQQCKRQCSKTCRHAANKSKCKSRCRSACR